MSRPLAFIDTETTGLDPIRHEMWEIAVIRRETDGTETEHLWQIRPSAWQLSHVAEPKALEIGRYHERAAVPEPAMAANMLSPNGPERLDFLGLGKQLVRALDGTVLIGSNPAFDAAFLGRFLRVHPLPWHYRVIDVATLAAGYVHARHGHALEDGELEAVTHPWSSYQLSRAVGVEPPSKDAAHTALGDARWARDVYDAVVPRAVSLAVPAPAAEVTA